MLSKVLARPRIAAMCRFKQYNALTRPTIRRGFSTETPEATEVAEVEKEEAVAPVHEEPAAVAAPTKPVEDSKYLGPTEYNNYI